MGRQSAPVGPAPGSTGLALARLALLGFGLAGGLGLFGLLQAELKLFFGQALGPTPKAMAVKRRAKGTPDRRAKGTPSAGVGTGLSR